MNYSKKFQKLIAEDQLAQAYLFFGFNRQSQFIFVQSLANFLENKQWRAPLKGLMDAKVIDGSRAESLGIDIVRDAKYFLWQKPIISSRRAFIVHQAENLTLEAQNAILKIAEEPPPHALIILIVRFPEVLLPTLQSRFQKIFISEHQESVPPRRISRRERISPPSEDLPKGENQSPLGGSPEGRELVQQFLKSAAAKRKEIIKELTDQAKKEDDNRILEDFVRELIRELRRDKIKNWPVIKEVLYRWSLMNQFNVNKRLQLEAVFIPLETGRQRRP
jgi:DNA polymerase III delta prime subunit